MNPIFLWFHKLGSPPYFYRFAGKWLPWLYALALITAAAGFYGALFTAPADYQQGDSFRIMYVHVPCAWMGLFAYLFMAANGFVALVWRIKLSETLAMASAPVGAAFTFITLVTGSLWGKPTWGTYWVWDARLTSVLVLFIIYLGLIALRQAIEDPGTAARAAAILTLVGSVNVPIIKFSVDWWNTLHQGESIFRADGPTIYATMLWPLLVMVVAMTVLFAALVVMAMRNEIYRRRVRNLVIMAAAA